MSTTFRHNIKVVDTLQANGTDHSFIREVSTLHAVLYSNGVDEYWIPRKVLEAIGRHHYRIPDWFLQKKHWTLSGFDPVEASKDLPVLIRETVDENKLKYSMYYKGSILASIISSLSDPYTLTVIQDRLGEILDNKRASEKQVQQTIESIVS